jgi:integrase
MAQGLAERRKVKSSLVFPGRKGGPLNDVRESLNGACRRAGVPHIRVHGLRHTFGSQMAMAGADPFAIMKAMGLVTRSPSIKLHMSRYISCGPKARGKCIGWKEKNPGIFI